MTLHVETRGEGPDLVLLHGWGLHGGTWGPWLEPLSRVARLHVVDLPGHGFSAWPRNAATLDTLADEIGGIVPDGAVVLGWSLGGMLAIELARQRRSLSALVLVATTPRFVADDDWPWGISAASLADFACGLRVDPRRTVQDFLALQTLGDERPRDRLRTLRAAVASRPAAAAAALATGLEILRTVDLRQALPRIAVPALVIAGERDRLTPSTACAELAASLPRSRYRPIPRAAHAPFVSNAPEVLGEVTKFLADSRSLRHDGAPA
jgi:pimeloyl-[acyl-carrier protein] methyl ester esterase